MLYCKSSQYFNIFFSLFLVLYLIIAVLIISPGTYISLDCEYVQVYGVHNDVYYDVARLSIVNYNGDVVLDTFVKPRRPVSKYMTHISGITSKDLVNGIPNRPHSYLH